MAPQDPTSIVMAVRPRATPLPETIAPATSNTHRRTAIPIAIALGLGLIGISWLICYLVRAKRYRTWRKKVRDQEARTGKIDLEEKETRVHRQDISYGTAGIVPEDSHPGQVQAKPYPVQENIAQPQTAVVRDINDDTTTRRPFSYMSSGASALHLKLAQEGHPATQPRLPPQAAWANAYNQNSRSHVEHPAPVQQATRGMRQIAGRRLTPYHVHKMLPQPHANTFDPDLTERNPADLEEMNKWAALGKGHTIGVTPDLSFVPSAPGIPQGLPSRVHPSEIHSQAQAATSSGIRANGLAPWPVLTREVQERDARWGMWLD